MRTSGVTAVAEEETFRRMIDSSTGIREAQSTSTHQVVAILGRSEKGLSPT